MQKTDLTKVFRDYYTARPQPEMVSFEEVRYLSVTGKGDPSSDAFSEKIKTLYPVAYAVKFVCKGQGNDFVVPKLEGLWWFDEEKFGNRWGMTEAPRKIPRSEWAWRLLIRMPDFVTEAMVREAARTVMVKKKLPLAEEVSLYPLTEGTVVQMLHVGPFATEPATLQQMMDFMEEHQLEKAGTHHEIYLSDFNKTAPEKIRTILREPVRKKSKPITQ